MNYLGHLYLSEDKDQILVGNFIADAVKGRNFLQYPVSVQDGIKLHRAIDFFTDQHPVVQKCNRLFAPAYGKYAGVVTDMVFDYYLASEWKIYSQHALPEFVNKINIILLQWFYLMPYKMQLIMPYWIKNRWPEIYSTKNGLFRALNGMPRYTSLPLKSEFVLQILHEQHQPLRLMFNTFISDALEEFFG